jgi:hypothetical protein
MTGEFHHERQDKQPGVARARRIRINNVAPQHDQRRMVLRRIDGDGARRRLCLRAYRASPRWPHGDSARQHVWCHRLPKLRRVLVVTRPVRAIPARKGPGGFYRVVPVSMGGVHAVYVGGGMARFPCAAMGVSCAVDHLLRARCRGMDRLRVVTPCGWVLWPRYRGSRVLPVSGGNHQRNA